MLETLICNAALCIGSTFMAAGSAPGTLPAAAMADDPKRPVIVHLVSREQTLTVRTGDEGLLFSLTGIDGRTLVANATDAEFEKLHPELHRHFRQTLAAKNDDAPVATATVLD